MGLTINVTETKKDGIFQAFLPQLRGLWPQSEDQWMAPVFSWTGKNSNNMNQRLEMWLGCVWKEIPRPHCLPSGCLHPVSRKRSSMTPSSTCFYLLTLVPHQVRLDSAPSLVPPTLWGAGIETFKVRNRGSYCLHFSRTACCAASSLSSCVPSSCLSADWHSLHQHARGGKCQPGPSAPLSLRLDAYHQKTHQVWGLFSQTPRGYQYNL